MAIRPGCVWLRIEMTKTDKAAVPCHDGKPLDVSGAAQVWHSLGAGGGFRPAASEDSGGHGSQRPVSGATRADGREGS